MGDPVPVGRIIYRPSIGGEVPVIDGEFAGGWRDA